MSPTTESAMATLIYEAIEDLTPRVAYKSSAWKAYARKGEDHRQEPRRAGPPLATAGVTESRRFRLRWTGGNYRPDGIWTNRHVETEAGLAILIDYHGNADDQHTIEYVAIDDYHHLRDTLNLLKNDPDNGIMLVTAGNLTVDGVDQENPTVVRYTANYTIRYLRETREVWSA